MTRRRGYFRITPAFADELVREGCTERTESGRRIIENCDVDAEVMTAEEMEKAYGAEMFPVRPWRTV